MYTRVLSACPLLGSLSSFGIFTVMYRDRREKVMQYFPYRIDLNIETRGRKKLKLDNEVKVSQNDKNPEL